MKKILVLSIIAILFCGSMQAQKNFYPAIIYQTDGKEIECLAKAIKVIGEKEVTYKLNKDNKPLKMKSINIKTIRYVLENDTEIEYDYCPIINIANVTKGSQKIRGTIWLEVKQRGPATLYHTEETYRKKDRSGTYSTYKVHNYYCKRESEEAASNLLTSSSRGIAIANNFHKIAPEYFADSPSISENIRNKEKGYKAEDIVAIVREYNAEKLAQQ